MKKFMSFYYLIILLILNLKNKIIKNNNKIKKILNKYKTVYLYLLSI